MGTEYRTFHDTMESVRHWSWDGIKRGQEVAVQIFRKPTKDGSAQSEAQTDHGNNLRNAERRKQDGPPENQVEFWKQQSARYQTQASKLQSMVEGSGRQQSDMAMEMKELGLENERLKTCSKNDRTSSRSFRLALEQSQAEAQLLRGKVRSLEVENSKQAEEIHELQGEVFQNQSSKEVSEADVVRTYDELCLAIECWIDNLFAVLEPLAEVENRRTALARIKGGKDFKQFLRSFPRAWEEAMLNVIHRILGRDLFATDSVLFGLDKSSSENIEVIAENMDKTKPTPGIAPTQHCVRQLSSLHRQDLWP